MCKSAKEHEYDNFKDGLDGEDDHAVSIVSSCMGSWASRPDIAADTDATAPANAKDWERLDKDQNEETIAESLKSLSNVRRKKVSAFILKDLLGDEADSAIKTIKQEHKKALSRTCQEENNVFRAVKYFDEKIDV